MEILCVDKLNIHDTVILSQMIHLLHFPFQKTSVLVREIRTFQITPPHLFAQSPKAPIRILHI